MYSGSSSSGSWRRRACWLTAVAAAVRHPTTRTRVPCVHLIMFARGYPRRTPPEWYEFNCLLLRRNEVATSPPEERGQHSVCKGGALAPATAPFPKATVGWVAVQMPAPLKNAIDWASRPLPSNEWAQKPTAIASIAGTFGGALWTQSMHKPL